MPIPPFGWQNLPNTTTPVNAANLEAMHAAAGAYADSVVGTSSGQTGWTLKAGNYTLLNTNSGVIVTATATITLPSSPYPGVRYGVKNFAPGITVTVTTGSTAVIDSGGGINATQMQIATQGQTLDFALAPNGTDWLIV